MGHTPSKECSVCGTTYFKKVHCSRKSWAKSRFCSSSCINKGRKPWNLGMLGVLVAWNKGRKSPEIMGENNPAWVGGDSKYYRKLVLTRDDYTCAVCGMRDVEIMQVDHIKPKAKFPELSKDPQNLQTLCPNCHARKTIKELKKIQ